MKLTEMKALLAAHGIRLTKSLGQNFLHDANQLRRIVAAAELAKSDRVLEIGPGLGPLTELLVDQAGEVLAIEKDTRLVKVLGERFNVGQAPRLSPTGGDIELATGGPPVLRLVPDDALDYLRREPRDWSEWKLVANLPYSVASPILVELAMGEQASARAPMSGDVGPRRPAGEARGPRRMVVTLQIEVAKRLLAQPGTPDYGVLTLLVQLDYEARNWFKIPASCFFPEPEVDSACVCLVRREQSLLPPGRWPTFATIVKRSFSQRRKMMLKLLKEDWPEARLAAEFDRLRLSRQIRAEEVALAQFTQLAQGLFRMPP